MRKAKILHKTDWVSLRRLVDVENNVEGYDYLHEDRCDGKIVVILPYRYKNNVLEFLLRKEVTPCWSMKQVISSITGGVEDGNVRASAINELAEEAGYEVEKKDLIYMDTSYGTKSCDTSYYIFTTDLTGKQKTLDGYGDGSELEREAICVWSDTIDGARDPLLYTAYYFTQQHIKLYTNKK